ncbi:MAG: phenylalanine--tRNA ligase subunit beta [Rubrimonas sp.]|uniref:phenylalanine--tRNA ligase subunit beta n=1 Tax=Rubrimonas sp. TaxID=2036015 RepID=UPI002FDDBA49
MKFTLGWLKEHLETDASVERIAEALTDLGLEVEGVEDPAATLGAFRIARVIEAGPHPDADKLRVCRVETWPDGPGGPSVEVQVVCGAPNARTGLVGVFAPPGTHIPGTGLDLKPGVIRGVESNGMLCSERELTLSDAHDGIIDLAPDAPLGARFIDYADLADPVIEIAITPNRPDALGVAGIARDLAARGLGRLITPAIEAVSGAFPCPVPVTLAPDVAEEACPLFIGRVVRGVKNGPSPDWLQKKLRAIGLRPISALVDVTNFLTLDRARPLHVFDADKVSGGLTVRLSRAGESLLALDGKTYVFDDAMTVICVGEAVESIGGVMGGEASGVTEATTTVFIEAAYFDPTRTAATGRKLRVSSDARYRFERGIDPAFTRDGLELATRLILDICGGEASEVVVAGAVPDSARSYALAPARVSSLVGMEIAPERQVETLRALGFSVEPEGAGFRVAPPSWRPDIRGEADLVEEIARVESLTKLQSQPLPRGAQGPLPPALTPMQRRARMARRALAASGLCECVTYSFTSGAAAALCGGGGDALALENPISSDLSHMRPSPLPNLLAAVARNQARGAETVALFEVGPGFHGAEPGEQTEQACLVRAGVTAPRDWSGERRPVDLWDARADAEALLAACGVAPDKATVAREAPDWMHPGRSAALKLGPKTTLAVFGELHPKLLAAMDVKGPVVAVLADLAAAPFPKAKGAARPALAASDLQAVERDFAFVVDARVEAAALLRAARGAEKKLIAAASVFDVFEGPRAEAQFGAGRKSIALSVRLQPTERTLTDEEIEAVAAKVVGAVEVAVGGALRA